jgi:hypothetical protein
VKSLRRKGIESPLNARTTLDLQKERERKKNKKRLLLLNPYKERTVVRCVAPNRILHLIVEVVVQVEQRRASEARLRRVQQLAPMFEVERVGIELQNSVFQDFENLTIEKRI